MKLGIKGKRALITGAGRGIGRAIALCLAKEGAHVAIVARTPTDIESLIKKMEENGQKYLGIILDLVEKEGSHDLVKRLQEDFGNPSIIVHNLGGTLNIKDPFCSIEDWRRVYRLNFEVAVELNTMLVPAMQEQKWGRVVHISSIASMENQGPVTYCATKAALTAYTRSFGGVVASDGVVVSAILPGAIFTEKGYWDIVSKKNPGHVKKYLTERQRIGRFGRPEEIGNFVAYLCSDLASFNTGSIIPIDGGQGRGYFGQ